MVHHPELADVWEQLDNAIRAPVKPVEQPKKLQLSLLPFQRHGVGWMRQQEEINDVSIWISLYILFTNMDVKSF